MWQCDAPASLGQLEGILRQILDVQRAQLDVQQAHLTAFRAQQQHQAGNRLEIQAVGEKVVEVAPASLCEADAGLGDSPRPGDERIPTAPTSAEEFSAPSSSAAVKGASLPEDETVPLAPVVPQAPSSGATGSIILFNDEVVEPSRAPYSESRLVRVESPGSQGSEILESLSVINAYKALSKAVWDTNERPDAEVYVKLKSMPRSVRRLMFFTGVFPAESHPGKMGFYSMYARVLQYIVWVIAAAWTAQWSIEAYLNRDGDRSLSGVHFPVFCLCCQVATAPYMMIWRSELGNGSQTLALLCSLDDVAWNELGAPTGVTVLMVLLYSACVIGVRMRYMLRAGKATTMVDVLLLSTSFIGLPALLWWIATVFGLAWLTTFGSKLHRFDLLKYATTLEGAILCNEAKPDLLEVIKKYEATVTTRLRHASRRWVRYGLFLFGLNTLAGLTICTYLLGDQHYTSERVACFVLLTAILAWNFMVSRSFTQVAETFEYDVLRSLNNPVVLSRVQKHMGQQFLNHLKCLDWGFRVSGTVISTQLSMQLSIPLVVGILTAAGKLMLEGEDVATHAFPSAAGAPQE